MTGDKAYQNAMRRRAELRQELDEIETFLRLYERYTDWSESAEARSAARDALTVRPADNPVPTQEHSTEHVAGMALVPHIRKAILDIGHPLSRGGVVKILSDRGIKVGGQNSAQNVATIMWRAKGEFINLKPHGYWPRNVAYAPANYDPDEHQGGNPEREDHKENGSDAAIGVRSHSDLWGS